MTFGNVEAEANNANTMSFKAGNDAYNNIVSSYSTDGNVALSFVHGTHAQKAYSAANKDVYYKQMIGANKTSVLDIINYDVNIGTDRLTSNFAVHGNASFENNYQPVSVYINSKASDSITPASLNISVNNTFDKPLVNLYTSPSSQFLIRTKGDKGLTIQSLSPISGINDALTIINNHTSNVNGDTISTTKYANIVKIYNKLEARDVEMLGLLKFIPTSGYRRSGGIDLDNVKLRTDSRNNLNIVANSICFGSDFDKMAWLKYDKNINTITLDAPIKNYSLSTTKLNSHLKVNGTSTVGALIAANTTIKGTLIVENNSFFKSPLTVKNTLYLDNVLYMQSNAYTNYSFKSTTNFTGADIACIRVMLEMTSFSNCDTEYFKCNINVHYYGKTIKLSGFTQDGNRPIWPGNTPKWCKHLVRFHLYGRNDNDLRIEPYYIDETTSNGGPEYITAESNLVVPAFPNTQILGVRSKSSYKTKICNRWTDYKYRYAPGVQIWMCDNNNNNKNEKEWNGKVTLLIYLLAYVNWGDIL